MGSAVPVETADHVRPLGVVPDRILLVKLVSEGGSKAADLASDAARATTAATKEKAQCAQNRTRLANDIERLLA